METRDSFIKDYSKVCITGGSGFIGSNLIKIIQETSSRIEILNLDLNKPKQESQVKYWKSCDINNFKKLSNYIGDFKPEYIIHLAADATMDGKNLDDYRTNIEGVENLINTVKKLTEQTSLIITSSQHVKKPGSYMYCSNHEYEPLGLYGKSKLISEKLIKQAELKQNWFIVRPTLVWGPGNLVMAESIFKYIRNNLYFHPNRDNTVRSYGYVENVCYQLLKLCTLQSSIINERIFYLADNNLLQIEWIDMASKLMGKGKTKTIPKPFLYTASFFGDFIKNFYPKFPLYKERFYSLTTSNPVPLDNTFLHLGPPKVDLYDAMITTINWLESYYADN